MNHRKPGPCLTRHASLRQRQRGIPRLIQQWLLEFGTEHRSNGATRLCFDKEARRRLAQEVGQPVVDHLAPLLNTYLVEGDNGRIVTTAWRRRRFRHR